MREFWGAGLVYPQGDSSVEVGCVCRGGGEIVLSEALDSIPGCCDKVDSPLRVKKSNQNGAKISVLRTGTHLAQYVYI